MNRNQSENQERQNSALDTAQFCSREHFQYLKGIAILAVVLGHIGNFSGKTWFTPLGGIGVVLFLFCSGYGLEKSYIQNKLTHFWRKKFISVYLPFMLVEIMASIMLKHSFANTVLDLLFIKGLHPFGWYMQYLVVCYIVFWFLKKNVGDPCVQFFIGGLISLATFFAFGNLQGEQAISFISGILLSDKMNVNIEGASENRGEGGVTKSRWIFSGITLMFVAFFFLAFKQTSFMRQQHHYLLTLLNLIMKVSCAAGIVGITWIWHPFNKIILWIGSISYALYLVHGYFMWIVSENRCGGFIQSSIVVLIVSFFVADILNFIIMRLHKLKNRWIGVGY